MGRIVKLAPPSPQHPASAISPHYFGGYFKQTSILISFYLSVLRYTSLYLIGMFYCFYITAKLKTTKNLLVSSSSPNSNLPLDCIVGGIKGFLLIFLKEVLVQLACLNHYPYFLWVIFCKTLSPSLSFLPMLLICCRNSVICLVKCFLFQIQGLLSPNMALLFP